MKEEPEQNGDTHLGYMSPFFRLVDDLGGDDEDEPLGVAGDVRPGAEFELGLRAQDDLRTLSIDDPDERRVEERIAFVTEELAQLLDDGIGLGLGGGRGVGP